MNSRVEKGKLLVMNWLFEMNWLFGMNWLIEMNWLYVMGDIGPVVSRLVMLSVTNSNIKVNLRFGSRLAKRVLIRSLLISKVAVSRMDGLVVCYYWFMVNLMMYRGIVFIKSRLMRH